MRKIAAKRSGEAASQAMAEAGPETPVILSLNGPPITAQTGGSFCEADICPSGFEGMYEQTGAAPGAALQSFRPDQLRELASAALMGLTSTKEAPTRAKAVPS